MTPDSILILRGGALGDFLVTLPLLKALRHRWPHARIECVGNSRAAQLAVLDGTLDAAHDESEARWAQLHDDGPLTPAFQSWLESFSLVLNYWPDPGGELARRFPLTPAQRHFAGGARIESRPACTHFFSPLTDLGLPSPRPAHLVIPDSCLTEAARLLQPDPRRMVIHPGSGSPRKNWPLKRWRELIDRLAPEPLLIVLGEAEQAMRGEMQGLSSHRIQIADTWPLPLLAAAISRCRMFVGHDTGVAHLAAAVGTPCVVLFGPTEPGIWAPYGENITVLKAGDDLGKLSVGDVVRHLILPQEHPRLIEAQSATASTPTPDPHNQSQSSGYT